jgi:hypothetical protein
MKYAAVVTLVLLAPAFIWAAATPATLEVVSDEGWCIIYVDGDRAGEIPLNGRKTTIRNIVPGEHFVKITDAFDNVWFDDVVDFPAGITLRSKAEPSGFRIINMPEAPPPDEGNIPGKGKTKIRTAYTSFHQVRALLYVNSDVPGEAVAVDGDDVGVTPIILKDIKPGKYVVSVGDRAEVEIEAKMTGLTEVGVSSQP